MRASSTRVTAGGSVRPLAQQIRSLFNGADGVWYDPDDFNRYMSVGPNLVVNGDGVDTTGWTVSGGTLTSVGGEFVLTANAGAAFPFLQRSLNLEVGKSYLISARMRVGTSGNSVGMNIGAGFSPAFNAVVNSTTTMQQWSHMAVATATSSVLSAVVSTASATAGTSVFDDISVRELTAINTATLFQDAAGTTPVVAVEQPVGLILDRSKGLVLGPELVPNGDFSQSSTGWTVVNADATHIVTFAGGGMRFQSDTITPQLYVSSSAGNLPAGKTYHVEAVCSQFTSGSVKMFETTNGTLIVNGVGKFTARITTPSVTQVIITRNSANVDLVLDSISIRELPGNHASQTTAASRPVLSARVNKIGTMDTRTFANASLLKSGTGITPIVTPNYGLAPDGSNTAIRIQVDSGAGTVSTDYSIVSAGFPTGETQIAAAYKFRIWARATSGTAAINLTGAGSVVAVRSLTTEWQKIELNETGIAGSTWAMRISSNAAYGTKGPQDIMVWQPELVQAIDANLPYQWNASATSYDTVGFPYYLRFDGIDDWLTTPSINFTGTDKMTVCAGVQKLGTTSAGIVVELGNASSSAFWFGAPGNGSNDDIFSVTGSIMQSVRKSNSAPFTGVYSLLSEIGQKILVGRQNGVAMTVISGVDLGTGNFSNNQLYIGRRGGTSLPFNGRLYGIIVRGAQSNSSEIRATERWMASKSGVTL